MLPVTDKELKEKIRLNEQLSSLRRAHMTMDYAQAVGNLDLMNRTQTYLNNMVESYRDAEDARKRKVQQLEDQGDEIPERLSLPAFVPLPLRFDDNNQPSMPSIPQQTAPRLTQVKPQQPVVTYESDDDSDDDIDYDTDDDSDEKGKQREKPKVGDYPTMDEVAISIFSEMNKFIHDITSALVSNNYDLDANIKDHIDKFNKDILDYRKRAEDIGKNTGNAREKKIIDILTNVYNILKQVQTDINNLKNNKPVRNKDAINNKITTIRNIQVGEAQKYGIPILRTTLNDLSNEMYNSNLTGSVNAQIKQSEQTKRKKAKSPGKKNRKKGKGLKQSKAKMPANFQKTLNVLIGSRMAGNKSKLLTNRLHNKIDDGIKKGYLTNADTKAILQKV